MKCISFCPSSKVLSEYVIIFGNLEEDGAHGILKDLVRHDTVAHGQVVRCAVPTKKVEKQGLEVVLGFVFDFFSQ